MPFINWYALTSVGLSVTNWFYDKLCYVSMLGKINTCVVLIVRIALLWMKQTYLPRFKIAVEQFMNILDEYNCQNGKYDTFMIGSSLARFANEVIDKKLGYAGKKIPIIV